MVDAFMLLHFLYVCTLLSLDKYSSDVEKFWKTEKEKRKREKAFSSSLSLSLSFFPLFMAQPSPRRRPPSSFLPPFPLSLLRRGPANQPRAPRPALTAQLASNSCAHVRPLALSFFLPLALADTGTPPVSSFSFPFLLSPYHDPSGFASRAPPGLSGNIYSSRHPWISRRTRRRPFRIKS